MTNDIKFRANAIFQILIFALSLLCCRLAWLQVMEHDKYAEMKTQQTSRQETLVAQRGRILDANGQVLAQSVPVQSLFAVPGLVDEKTTASAELARLLDLSESDLFEKFSNTNRKFIWIKRHLTEEQSLGVRTLFAEREWKGFGFRQEYRRVYPQGRTACHVLGTTDIDQRGMDGIERKYDKLLAGRDGFRVLNADALRRGYVSVADEEVMPQPGADIRLTIDVNIQRILEESIAKTFTDWKAESVSAVVLDPATGEVLAMANMPDFDPNNAGAFPPDNRRNRALTDSFEPGSMNKPFIVSKALELGLVTSDTKINCERGFWKYRARRVKDVHPYGMLSVRDVIAKSSNIGTTKIGLQLQEFGVESRNNYIRDTMINLGFGQKSGIDLPGEEGGKVTAADKWSYHSDVSVCFGYEVTVTPLQMTLAAALWANGGVLMKPHVVNLIDRPLQGRSEHIEPVIVRRVYEPETMDTVDDILRKVVEDGTAKSVRLKEYEIAGKTGTSHKVKNGHYVNDYISSFIGYAPAEDPRVIVLVSVNSPHGRSHYGGTVAGPAVRDTIDKTLRYMKIPSVQEQAYAVPGFAVSDAAQGADGRE